MGKCIYIYISIYIYLYLYIYKASFGRFGLFCQRQAFCRRSGSGERTSPKQKGALKPSIISINM